MAGRTRSSPSVNDLADHAQVILHFQFWQADAGRTYDVSGTGLDWELDWKPPKLPPTTTPSSPPT
ncbi:MULTISPECIES: hypothetical protein [unclassified Streptomyces]|uniref:hypothetical protein n=1 Tax=unclassified Streptomyces TaxID=2593676 RepID=UPI002E0F105E|nr:hypothetical protein OG348_13755 [Streptomyces sp. NBC_01243]